MTFCYTKNERIQYNKMEILVQCKLLNSVNSSRIAGIFKNQQVGSKNQSLSNFYEMSVKFGFSMLRNP